MDEEVTIIDPEGDLLIILIPESDPVDSESNSNSDSDGMPSPKYTWNLPTTVESRERKFKVSIKHMTVACRRAKIMFSGNWKENTCVYPDGLHHWTIRARFDGKAFESVLLAIHLCTDLKSSRLKSLTELCEIAFVANDLQCAPAMGVFSHSLLKSLCSSEEEIGTWDLQCALGLMYASSVLCLEEYFKAATRRAIYLINDEVHIPTHLITGNILDGIKKRRIEALIRLNSAMWELQHSLDGRELTVCHYGIPRCEEQLSVQLESLTLEHFYFGHQLTTTIPLHLTICQALNVVYRSQDAVLPTPCGSIAHDCHIFRILLRTFKQFESSIYGLELKDFVKLQG